MTALLGIGLVTGTEPAYADQDRVPSLDINGEITIGAVFGEEVLRQAFPGADQLARDAFSSVEGTVLMRINGKLVRVTKGDRTVVEILDDPGTFTGEAWEQDEEKKQEAWKKADEQKRGDWKRHQERQREQAKKAAEREREARKRAAEQAREARKDREELNRELRKSREERWEAAKEDRQVRL